MMNSVESRVPFCDPDIVDFISQVPAKFKIRNGYTKYILRKCLKNIIPEETLNNRNKKGYPSPQADWLKESFGLSNQANKEWRKFIIKKWREMIILSNALS